MEITSYYRYMLSSCATPCSIAYCHVLAGDFADVVCPKLEKLILVFHFRGERFNMTSVVEMVAVRAPRGMKLRTIKIVDRWGTTNLDVSELGKHVWKILGLDLRHRCHYYCTITTNPARGWLMTKKIRVADSSGGPDDNDTAGGWPAV